MRETFRQSSLISGNVPRNRSIAEIGADACTCSPTVQIMHVPWKEKRYAAHLRRTYLQQSYPIPYFEAFVSLFFFFFFFFNTFTFLVEKSECGLILNQVRRGMKFRLQATREKQETCSKVQRSVIGRCHLLMVQFMTSLSILYSRDECEKDTA